MADIYGEQYTMPVIASDDGNQYCMVRSYTFSGTEAVGDVIHVCPLPQGALVTDVALVGSGTTTAAFKVQVVQGDGTRVDVKAAGTLSATRTRTTAAPVQNGAGIAFEITLAAAAGDAGVVATVIVNYVLVN